MDTGNGAAEFVRVELFRQRRQLLWLTFALAIYYWAGVQLGHEAETQGVKLSVQYPQFLVWAAWCAWAWSLWRYWQYERTHPDSNYQTWREHQLWVTAVRIGSRKAYDEAASQRPQDLPAESTVELSLDREIQTSPTLNGGLHIKNYGLEHRGPDGRKGVTGTTTTNLTEKEFRYAQRQGQRDFWIGRPFVLDYKAPYLLALLALLARIWTWLL
jgi:hypothetical protein